MDSGKTDRQFLIIEQPEYCAEILHFVTLLFLTAQRENVENKEKRMK